MQITIKPNEKVIELGGGAHPVFRPNVDARVCRDAQGNPTVDFTADFDQPLPIQSGEWDCVFSRFVIEHLSWRKVRQFISEVHRILKPGGRAIIITANVEAQLKWLAEHPDGWDGKPFFESASEILFGSQDYEHNHHKNYMAPALAEVLFREAGFTSVAVHPYGERATDMLIEALKPAMGSRPVFVSGSSAEVSELVQRMVDSVNLHPPLTRPPEPAKAPTPSPDERAALFGHRYFDGGHYGGGYADGYKDYPCHELTFRQVMARKPESVLELGCGRGYVLKRLQDAGVSFAQGMEISKHCFLSRACEGILLHDVCQPWPYPNEGTNRIDLCFSIAVLEHLPEEHLSAVIKEMARTCQRGLHGVTPAGPGVEHDKTKFTIRPLDWWRNLFAVHAPGWPVEVVDKNELEQGNFPQDVLRGDGKCKINCGSYVTMFHHGWVNIDQHDLLQYATQQGYNYLRHDLRTGLPFNTGSVHLIYASHFLEHLSYADGLKFLRECRRAIRPDGAMRLAVPDAGLLTNLYSKAIESQSLQPFADFNEISWSCLAASTAAGKLWALLHDGHQAAYDFETLAKALEESGFEARRSAFRTAEDSLSHAHYPGTDQILRETVDLSPCLSLYVNAAPRMDS